MRKTKKVIRRFLTILIIVLFVFSVSFVGFGYLVNKYSPEVDVSIGENTQYNPNEKIANIDDRLKEIHNEDNEVSEKEDNSAQNIKKEEKEKEQKIDKEVKKQEDKKPKDNTESEKDIEKKKAPIPQKLEIINQTDNSTKSKTKVFAGYYTSLEQAVVAQNELKELIPNTSPFIKELNGYYIVQMGVFSNPDKALDLYAKIKSYNFPAKMKTE